MNQNRISQLVNVEGAIFVLSLAVVSWIIYKVFLRSVAPHRHKNLGRLFSNLLRHALVANTMLAFYELGTYSLSAQQFPFLFRMLPYLGFFCLVWNLTVFVKTCRIFAFEYLFLKHMRAGVPLLIVNLVSLLLSGILAAWVMNQVFEIQLAPVLATSAVFSLVLGLALQDTLGNLFAGVALQLDKPFDLGDWIEVHHDKQIWVGMVSEISWRATVLIGFLEEVQSIPNRVIAQAQISNYSGRVRPVLRSQMFRVGFGQDSVAVKKTLLESIRSIPGVRRDPQPIVIIVETTDSWATYKLVYSIDDFGAMFIIGDRVISEGLNALKQANIEIAPQRLELRQAKT